MPSSEPTPLDIMNEKDISFSPPTSYIRVEDVVLQEEHGMGENGQPNASYYNNMTEDHFIDTHGGKYFQQFTEAVNSIFYETGETEAFLSHRKSLRSQSKLNQINVLNFVAFFANMVMAYLVGIWALHEIGGCVKFWEVWESHITLVTPRLWTNVIWGPMYLFEAVFAFAQLAPSIRARPMVQEGCGYFSIYASLSQIGWTTFFAFEMFLPSFIFIATTVAVLVCLLLSQHLVASGQQNKSRREYWLLQFPFLLHMGWATIIMAVNLAIMAQEEGASKDLELTIAMILMGVLLLVSFLFLSSPTKPDFVVPLIILWAFIGIGFQLHNDEEILRPKFGSVIISACSNTAFAFAVLVGTIVLPRVLLKIYHQRFTIQVSSN